MKRLLSTFTLVLTILSFTAISLAANKKPTLTKKQLEVLIATAKTPSDHRTISEYYKQEALRFTAKAQEHEEIGAMYQKNPLPYEGKFPYGTVGLSHCRRFVELYKEEAKEAEALAALHEKMAKAAEHK